MKKRLFLSSIFLSLLFLQVNVVANEVNIEDMRDYVANNVFDGNKLEVDKMLDTDVEDIYNEVAVNGYEVKVKTEVKDLYFNAYGDQVSSGSNNKQQLRANIPRDHLKLEMKAYTFGKYNNVKGIKFQCMANWVKPPLINSRDAFVLKWDDSKLLSEIDSYNQVTYFIAGQRKFMREERDRPEVASLNSVGSTYSLNSMINGTKVQGVNFSLNFVPNSYVSYYQYGADPVKLPFIVEYVHSTNPAPGINLSFSTGNAGISIDNGALQDRQADGMHIFMYKRNINTGGD